MMHIDEDKMSEEIEGFIETELDSSDFRLSVIGLVWETLFGGIVLTDEENAAAAKVFDTIYQKCVNKMLKALKS